MAIIQQKTYGYHTAENVWLSHSRKLMAIIQQKTSDHIQQEINSYHTSENCKKRRIQ